MTRIYDGVRITILGALTVLSVAAPLPAAAKGYAGGPDTANDSNQQIRRRLTQVEEKQKSLQNDMAAEVQKLRAELADIKQQSAIKASFTTTK